MTTETTPGVAGAEPAVRELADREAIRDCIYRYCRGVDRFDRQLMLECYHPGAIDDHGQGELSVEQFIEYAMSRDPSRSRVHHVGNILIELHGDTALVETYWMAYQAWMEGERQFVRSRCGRYADNFERRGGRWAIMHRRVIDDWSAVQQADRIEAGLSVHRGGVYPCDPIYRWAGPP